MTLRIGIHGYGRVGRLALRAGWGAPDLAFTRIYEIACDATASAHLTTFDSLHGTRQMPVSGDEDILREAAEDTLAGILGYEERPLVSIDFLNDPRSAIVDALSTRVVDGRHVKILPWYDNEWACVQRMIDLARMVVRARQ